MFQAHIVINISFYYFRFVTINIEKKTNNSRWYAPYLRHFTLYDEFCFGLKKKQQKQQKKYRKCCDQSLNAIFNFNFFFDSCV